MKYNGLKEITPGFPQHTYFLNKAGRLIAYRKASDDTLTVLDNPLSFSRSKRKFEKIFDASVMHFEPLSQEVNMMTIEEAILYSLIGTIFGLTVVWFILSMTES